MTIENTEIQVKQGSKVGLRPSKDLNPAFGSVGIGADQLPIEQSDTDQISMGARLKVSPATDADDVPTKGQVDSTTGGLDDRVTETESDIAALEAADAALDARLTDAEDEIDVLDANMASILANNPAEDVQQGDGVTTVFTIPFEVSDDNTVKDLEVFVDGRRNNVAMDGVFDQNYKNFKKNSETEVEFAVAPPNGKSILFWKQGTAVVADSGSVDLTNIIVNIQPAVHGAKSVGTVTKAFSGVFLKDKTTAQVYELNVDNGIFDVTEVP